jgi:hypothetical protein
MNELAYGVRPRNRTQDSRRRGEEKHLHEAVETEWPLIGDSEHSDGGGSQETRLPRRQAINTSNNMK